MSRIVITALAILLAFSACDKGTKDAKTDGKTTATSSTDKAEKPKKKIEDTDPAEDPTVRWVTSDYFGVKFRVPAEWKVKADPEAISVTSPDSAITVLVVGTGSESVLSEAIDELKKQVEFKDVKLANDGQTVLNGMPGHTAQGTAVLVKESGEQEIQFIMNAVQPGKKGVAMMTFAEAEMYEARKEELQGITKTLQKN